MCAFLKNNLEQNINPADRQFCLVWLHEILTHYQLSCVNTVPQHKDYDHKRAMHVFFKVKPHLAASLYC